MLSGLGSTSLQPSALLKGTASCDDFAPYNNDLRSSLKRDTQSPLAKRLGSSGRVESVTQAPFDEVIEKNLIKDLLREKNELEKNL